MPGSAQSASLFMAPPDNPIVVEPDYHIILPADNSSLYTPSPAPQPPNVNRNWWLKWIVRAMTRNTFVDVSPVQGAGGTYQNFPSPVGPSP